jgi:hypothetical protein
MLRNSQFPLLSSNTRSTSQGMFVGHLGAGLILRSPNHRIGLGTLFLCSMALDIILWILVLAHIETVHSPEKLNSMADIRFDFPYSHSLVAAIGWALFAFALVYCWRHDVPSSLAAGAVVFSHFILDWLVHIPELPIATENSTKLGLGLWQNLSLAWTIECAIAAAGLILYLKRNRPTKPRALSLAILILLLTIMTIAGQASKTPPPSIIAMAATSLASILIITALAAWLDHFPRTTKTDNRVPPFKN